MGMYCLRALIPVHTAGAGEIMEILWSDYYGAVLFGEGREIACIPHKGCRLEVVATAPTSHREVNFLLPGQVIRYTRSFFFVDRFGLPSGTKVGLFAPSMPLAPIEDLMVGRPARRVSDRVTVG